MITRLLNDIKEGHYFWIRKKSAREVARTANARVMFISLMGIYASLWILGYGIFHRLTGKSFQSGGFFADVLLFTAPYLGIYFLLVHPHLSKGEIDEHVPGTEKNRKARIARIYFILVALSLPVAGLIFKLLAKS
ncbi:hypothetical protein [Dyadobacter fermentans]|uniref:hypothetical protein n=1 Tax=Dyadobacter fermentans TaxID=94254 RepID=UPI001CBAED8E|nr:hypothetical protein [Dyadobacter fermentans]MBZ1362716.1 hypothetical protein [Dyadobacter fermentans]